MVAILINIDTLVDCEGIAARLSNKGMENTRCHGEILANQRIIVKNVDRCDPMPDFATQQIFTIVVKHSSLDCYGRNNIKYIVRRSYQQQQQQQQLIFRIEGELMLNCMPQDIHFRFGT